MNENDEIEQAAALAEIETGARNAGATLRLCRAQTEKPTRRRWTAGEDAFIRENNGRLTHEEMGAHLGRTPTSVLIHIKREMHLVAPSKAPEIVTGEQVAWGLGMGCGKSVHRLIDNRIMPGRRLPGADVTRVVDRAALLRWMLEPAHWIYFNPERVGSLRLQGARGIADCYDYKFWEDARELVLKARAAWKDEWLTPGQAADAIGYKNRKTGIHSINAAIVIGTLKATRWGNWRIRRSALPPADMTINVYGKIVPKAKLKYKCPRGMAHPNLSTCMKLKFCREAAACPSSIGKVHDHKSRCSKNCSARKP